MIAAATAISRVGQPASTPSKSRTGWAFQPLPNLNREIRQAVGRRKAGWTFAVICTELGYAVHKGRASWDTQRLGIGLRAVARESGQSIGKVRRDVAALAELGLVVIHRPNVMHTADPATGRITQKATGRCENTLLYLTITPAVLRPAKVHAGTKGGTSVIPPRDVPKVQPGTTFRDSCSQRTKQRRPDGLAAGIGQPPATAAAEGGLTAAGTGTATDTTGTPTGLPDASQGRLPAAGAGGGLAAATGAGRLTAAVFEGQSDPVVPLDAGRDMPPALPADRVLPAKKPVPPDPEAAARHAERQRRDRLAGEYAYHLGIEKAVVIELGRADPAGLRRRLIEAGVDPSTGRPRRAAAPGGDRGRHHEGGEDHHRDAWRRALSVAADE